MASVSDVAVRPQHRIAPGAWKGKHVVSGAQFDVASLTELFRAADYMRVIVHTAGGAPMLQHRVCASVFYEPSTRTSSSFAAAMQRLGGTVLPIAESTSSAAKGETLSDSIASLQCYADVVVLRHSVAGSALVASAACDRIPFLNAGDGVGEHPTQSLLDLYTILREKQRGVGGASGDLRKDLEGLQLTLMGDLRNGRTVHSLAKLLAQFQVGFTLVSPPALCMPEEVVSYLTSCGVGSSVAMELSDAVLARTRVLYCTRVQKERFTDLAEYERFKLMYVVDASVMARAPADLILMHPLPRTGEIAPDVDADPRAAYFRQMRNGLFLRMALLALLCGVDIATIESHAVKAAEAAHLTLLDALKVAV